jgi:signal transduction histidine kinase
MRCLSKRIETIIIRSTDMPHLALVSSNRMVERTCAGHMTHDLRNLLATVGLHLETLERLAGPHGAKAASGAQALIGKAAGLCNTMLAAEAGADGRPRRSGVDVGQVARDIVALLQPTAPQGFAVEIESQGGVALADPNAVFRILFNLISNAVTVARTTGKLTRLGISIAREAQTVVVGLTDNGPGLPVAVRKHLFRPQPGSSAGHGHGLAIVRDLVDRNGGTITLTPTRKGTAFVLTLPALAAMVQESPLTRSLGQRAAR